MDDFVGTALVLAFIQVATLMPVAQLAERRSAAKRHFAGVTTPAGRDFTKTCTDFVTLVSPGILNGTRRWLPTARLWRRILSQNVEGYWDASTTTAFALEARAQAETDTLPKLSFAVRLTTSLSVYATEGAKEATLFFAETARNELRVSSDKKRAELIAAEEVTGSDCPLTCHRHSIIETMPKALAEVHDADSEVDVARVWTTLLCIKMLEGYAYNFISGDGDLYPETERTIVDAGREWLEAQAQAHPALGAALQDGSIRRAAGSVTRLWARATEQRVMELRRCEGIRKQMNYSHVHRTMTSLTRAFALQHTTMSTFLAQPLDGIQRWQKFVILVTLVISQLLVNIWMFYSKAVNCCADVRAVIDADTGNCPPVGACRGTAENANCGDLTKQFETVPVLPDYPHGLKDYKCTAWPDDDRPLDTFVVGLISIAVALPVSLFMFSCFAMANDSEAPESWLNWSSPVMKLFFGLNANRRWNYTAGAQPTRYVKWYVRSVDAPKPETMINLCHSLWAFVLRRDTPWIKEWKEVEAEKKMAAEAVEAAPEAAADKAPSEGSSMRSAHALGAYKRMLMTSGIVSGIICWAIFTWFVFTYGMLIYRLLGDGAQDSFARSWGISYGLNAATEWRDIMIEAAKGAIILAILERLFLTRPLYWLEEHMDYLSLQALILKQTSLNFWGQIRVFYAHTKRVS